MSLSGPRHEERPAVLHRQTPSSPHRAWPGRLFRRRLLLHSGHNVVSRRPARPSEASALSRLPKVSSYLGPVQFGELLQRDVTEGLAGTLQHAIRIVQVHAALEPEVHVFRKDADDADAVLDDSFRRAIHQGNLGALLENLRTHLEDVFMTRRHLLEDHLPKAERQRLDGGIVPIEEFEQLGRWFRHATAV